MADRGRHAEKPREIPAEGWKDIAYRVKEEVAEDRVTFVAAGIAFYLLLSMIPMLGAFIATYGVISDPSEVTSHLETLEGVLPLEAVSLVEGELMRLAKNQAAAGIGLVISILVAVWGGSKAMNALMIALNVVYDEEETRNFFKTKLLGLALTMGSILVLLTAAALMSVIPAVIAFVPLPSAIAWVLELARWPALFALAMIWIGVLYRYAPDRENAKWRWVSWGSFIATFIWVIGSMGFAYYVENFGNYSGSFGSLGAIVILLMWFYITGLCILLGAEINSEMEHQTQEDSTTGPDKPRGERGAYVADDIGSARGE